VTIGSSFTIVEPRCNADTFIRWALLDKTVVPLFVVTKIDFATTVTLSHDASAVLNNPNAGGSSALSEALSFEVLRVQFGAQLCRTEMQIRCKCASRACPDVTTDTHKDWTQSKITDYSITIGCERIGVSVTRACVFKGDFTDAMAKRLLTKKLFGVVDSSAHVITPHAWKRQVLHVWCQEPYIADVLRRVYNDELDAALTRDTLVICTVAHGAEWIFFGSKAAPKIVTCT
jgi:hypothetical protein